jgi:hypothetical protein
MKAQSCCETILSLFLNVRIIVFMCTLAFFKIFRGVLFGVVRRNL